MLNLPSAVSVVKALERYFSAKKTKNKCSLCKKNSKAKKRIQAVELPPILVLKLGSTPVNGVHVDEALDLAPFLRDESVPSAYQLFAVISKRKSSAYHVLVQRKQDWIKFAKDKVRLVRDITVQLQKKQRTNITLFYSRDETIALEASASGPGEASEEEKQ